MPAEPLTDRETALLLYGALWAIVGESDVPPEIGGILEVAGNALYPGGYRPLHLPDATTTRDAPPAEGEPQKVER